MDFASRSARIAIFAQTSGTDLNLSWDWATAADLNSVHGTFVLPTFSNVTFDVDAEVFTIPESGGIAVVPDLSLFHQIIQGRETGIATGQNEHRMAGQGIGRAVALAFVREGATVVSTSTGSSANTTATGPFAKAAAPSARNRSSDTYFI